MVRAPPWSSAERPDSSSLLHVWPLPACHGAVCPATVPDMPADGWRLASSSGLWDDMSVLLPIPADTQLVQAIALARSLVHHNARAPMNLVLACDLAALRRMLGPLHDAIHASEASGATVHVIPLESLPNVASAAWLAIELLPGARGLLSSSQARSSWAI